MPAPSRKLSLGHILVPGAFRPETPYDVISADDETITPDESLLASGVDLGLLRLHIANAPERRQVLGLLPDRSYEIMVVFQPVHLHPTGATRARKQVREAMQVRYARFFNIDRNDSAGGFGYRKMFERLVPRDSLSIDVQLTEIDNRKVDPTALEALFQKTDLDDVMDLSPLNPGTYLKLASDIVGQIQTVFGSDKPGDDRLWDDRLEIEAAPTLAGAYRLTVGRYAIVEGAEDPDFSTMRYERNRLVYRDGGREIAANYLVFAVGKSKTPAG